MHGVSNSGWHCQGVTATAMLVKNWHRSKRYMAANIHKVKHWELIEGDYTKAPDIEATWFVDPPYQGTPGLGYRHGSKQLDYGQLAGWVQQRQGEVIVCDHATADWLPFQPLTFTRASVGTMKMEGLFYSSPFKKKPDLLDWFGP